ncbi:hypothetical protein BPA30113_07482 [Burkholderia paludis]|uniref:Uncharacterized protein n=1 Tax=Burkholderia paludis TaxID=1506587 RepID=A0A6J5FA49_9BURK|nr:hypothetical protein LMG30113_07447 [Burkholderia paludis]VWC48030.1 hypothetical protein BPA30113_07482 [Burkholderia paludis]
MRPRAGPPTGLRKLANAAARICRAVFGETPRALSSSGLHWSKPVFCSSSGTVTVVRDAIFTSSVAASRCARLRILRKCSRIARKSLSDGFPEAMLAAACARFRSMGGKASTASTLSHPVASNWSASNSLMRSAYSVSRSPSTVTEKLPSRATLTFGRAFSRRLRDQSSTETTRSAALGRSLPLRRCSFSSASTHSRGPESSSASYSHGSYSSGSALSHSKGERSSLRTSPTSTFRVSQRLWRVALIDPAKIRTASEPSISMHFAWTGRGVRPVTARTKECVFGR